MTEMTVKFSNFTLMRKIRRFLTYNIVKFIILKKGLRFVCQGFSHTELFINYINKYHILLFK